MFNFSENIYIDHSIRNFPFQMNQLHHHPRYEIYFLADLTGKGFTYIGSKKIELKKNALVLIDQNLPHRNDFTQASSHERYLLELSPTLFNDHTNQLIHIPVNLFFKQNTGVHQLDDTTLNQIKRILLSIYDDSIIHKKYYEDIVRLRVMEIILLLSRFIENQEFDRNEFYSIQKKNILKITQYINENYMDPLSLDYLAKSFFLSKPYLAKAFKQTMGVTLHTYINQIRIRHAQRLLIMFRDYTVDEISQHCGFNHPSYFIKQFKHITGMTPLQFRKKYC